MARSDAVTYPLRNRSNWLLGGLLAGFALVFLRLFWLQVVCRQHYVSDVGQRIAVGRASSPPPTPGRILGSDNEVLAYSAPLYHLIGDPARMLKVSHLSFADCAAKIAPLINRPADAIAADLESHRKRGYVELARWLRQDTAKALRDLKIEGLSTRQVWLRKYPLGKTACHVLGGRDRYHHALAGLEYLYRGLLDGEPGVGGAAAYAPGLEGLDVGYSSLPPEPGEDLVLTIVPSLQRQVETEMDRLWAVETPKWCTCIIEDVRTGALLALSSRPNYDPMAYSMGQLPPGHHGPVVPPANTVNWPVTRQVEQGSTFKVILAAAALSSGRVSPNRTFVCNGHLSLGGPPIGCWGKYAAHGHGRLDMAGMLANSCNLCAAQTALVIGRDYYRSFLDKCGIGHDPEAGFPGEARGHVQKTRFIRPRDLGTMAFGQNVSCSSLQLTSVVAGLVNKGQMMHPRIVARVQDHNGTLFRDEPPRLDRVLCTPEVSRQLCTMLEGVVTNGTGKAATIPGVRVGGKTGTAQQWDPILKRHSQDRYLVSFIMVFPTDQPRYIIHVACMEPQHGRHGADVAAPFCQRLGKFIVQQLDRQIALSPVAAPAAPATAASTTAKPQPAAPATGTSATPKPQPAAPAAAD